MNRRIYYVGRAMTLSACAGLALLAFWAWIDVAAHGERPYHELPWGRWDNADGARFYLTLMPFGNCGWELKKFIMIVVEDCDAPPIDGFRRWLLPDPGPGGRSIAYIPEVSIVHTLGTYTWDRPVYQRSVTVTAHLAELMLAFGLWPLLTAVQFARRRRRLGRRRKLGLCLACGYDLRGSEGARCSECGAPTGGRESPAAERR